MLQTEEVRSIKCSLYKQNFITNAWYQDTVNTETFSRVVLVNNKVLHVSFKPVSTFKRNIPTEAPHNVH